MKALRNAFKGSSSSTPTPSSQPESPTKSSNGLKSSSELKNSSELKASGELKPPTNALSSSQETPVVELKDEQVQQEDRKRLFSKLTGLMGKDIVSLLSLPVSLFEPTSVLQTMVEPLRNSELLFKVSRDAFISLHSVFICCYFCISFYIACT